STWSARDARSGSGSPRDLVLQQRNLARLRSLLHRRHVGVDVREVLVAQELLRITRHLLARVAHLLRESLPRPHVVGDARPGAAIAALACAAVARVAHVLREGCLAARHVAGRRFAMGRHRVRAGKGGAEPFQFHVSSSSCSVIAAAGSLREDTRRSASETTPPASRNAPLAQKTGSRPKAEPMPPKTTGTTICVSLFTVRRMPSASPERPAGAWLYVRMMVSGCAQPRPMPRPKATSASSSACETNGTMR